MMGMGTALTGLIIKMKVVTVCGVVGALASVGCIYVHGFDQILVFASAFVFYDGDTGTLLKRNGKAG